jgi:hypothetical protein
LKPLNEIQLNYIKTLPKEKILELLEIYNNDIRPGNLMLDKKE